MSQCEKKKFECKNFEMCQKQFATNAQRHSHQKNCGKTFRCSECSSIFESQSGYYGHTKKLHPNSIGSIITVKTPHVKTTENVFDTFSGDTSYAVPATLLDSAPSDDAADLFRMNRLDREMGNGSIKEDDESFQVTINVSHFELKEISVKTIDKNIIVHAKHEERSDQAGGVSREFCRRVSIPQGVNPESVTSIMSPEGILTIVAPKMMLEGAKERVIPITMAPSAGSSTTATPIQGK